MGVYLAAALVSTPRPFAFLCVSGDAGIRWRDQLPGAPRYLLLSLCCRCAVVVSSLSWFFTTTLWLVGVPVWGADILTNQRSDSLPHGFAAARCCRSSSSVSFLLSRSCPTLATTLAAALLHPFRHQQLLCSGASFAQKEKAAELAALREHWPSGHWPDEIGCGASLCEVTNTK